MHTQQKPKEQKKVRTSDDLMARYHIKQSKRPAAFIIYNDFPAYSSVFFPLFSFRTINLKPYKTLHALILLFI
jgi:hypothetical protein